FRGNSETAEHVAGRLWDAATGKEIAPLQWPALEMAFVCTAEFSPDGSRTLTAGTGSMASGSVCFHPPLWNATTGQLELSLKTDGRGETQTAASLSPDGQWVISRADYRTPRLWSLANGKQVGMLRGHEQNVTFAAFSPDGQHLVTTSEDRTARLWTAPQDADSAPRHGRWLNLEGADFSSDGRRLVGVLRWQEDNDRVRVWDTATGQELARLEGHPQEVRTAVFSPDG